MHTRFLITLYGCIVWSSLSGLEIRCGHSLPLCTAPGKIISLNVILDNQNGEELEFAGQIILPDGWRKIFFESEPFRLEEGGLHQRMVAFQVPRNTLAGDYTVQCGSENQVLAIPIHVESNTEIDMEYEEKALLVAAGEVFTFGCTCINRGNSTTPVCFEVSSDPCGAIITGQLEWNIAPGEKIPFRLAIDTSSICSSSYMQYIFLKVRHQETDEILYRRTVALEVLPRGVNPVDPYVRIPATLAFSVFGDEGQTDGAIDFVGGGVYDPENERRVDFFFRLPTDLRNVVYDQIQRMTLGFRDPHREVILGDTTYAITPVLERGFYGRGGSFAYQNERFEAGAFFARNIFHTSYAQQDVAAYISGSPQLCCWVSGNYLHKSLNRDPNSDIVSLLAERETERAYLSVEFARNLATTPHRMGKTGYRFEARGPFRDTGSFYFEKNYAGPHFYGYSNDMDLTAASLEWIPRSRFRAYLSGCYLKQNLHPTKWKKQLTVVAPRQRQYNAQLTYLLNERASLSLTGMLLRAKDVKIWRSYDFDQRWIGLNYTWTIPNFNLIAIGALGEQKDFLHHHKQESLQRYSLYINWTTARGTFCNFMYDCGHTNYYDAKPWRNAFGLTLRRHFGPRTWAEAFGQFAANNPNGSHQYQLAFKFNHIFKNDHLLTLNVHRLDCTHFKHDREYLFICAYTIPLSIPVRRRQDIGSITGQLLDQETNAPISDAIVALDGSRALTDRYGFFSYQGLCPGLYEFQTSMLPDQKINAVPEPMQVEVCGGKDRQLRVAAVSQSKFSGRVLLFDYCYNLEDIQHPELKEQGSLAEIEITVAREGSDELYSYITGISGEFNFATLRPGLWHVHVDPARLPPGHRLEFNDFTIEIAPKENFKVDLRAMPNKWFRTPVPDCTRLSCLWRMG